MLFTSLGTTLAYGTRRAVAKRIMKSGGPWTAHVSSVLLVMVISSTIVHADVKITEPENDALVIQNTIIVKGTGNAADGTPIKLTVAGVQHQTVLRGGEWSIGSVQVPSRPAIFHATIDGGEHIILVTGVNGPGAPQPRAVQKVRLVWGAGVDNELKMIAHGTLNLALTPAHLEAFVMGVKAGTEAAFLRAYANVGIELVDAAGPSVHTIRMTKRSNGFFGQSPYDCNNQNVGQTTDVFVGTYREKMVTLLDHEMFGWQPMQRTDGLHKRIVDVAEALGRTSAHEFGHSLGLVGSGLGRPCGWMSGCGEWHNCEQTEQAFSHAKIDRFNGGFFIMDPGLDTPNNARLAEPSKDGRAPTRQPAIFNKLNGSYLQIVHP